ncbi:hypothetical protein PMAYCL1PPCAC_08480, partial [Pristionchus mayeri]
HFYAMNLDRNCCCSAIVAVLLSALVVAFAYIVIFILWKCSYQLSGAVYQCSFQINNSTDPYNYLTTQVGIQTVLMTIEIVHC